MRHVGDDGGREVSVEQREPTSETPPRGRDALARAAGCLLWPFFLWFALSVGIAIAALVAEQIMPALGERGYNVRNGAGVFIAIGLGLIVAIYPVIWLHRLGRRLLRGRTH